MKIRTVGVALAAGVAVLLACTTPVTVDRLLDRAEEVAGGHDALAGVHSMRIRAHGTWGSPALGFPASEYEAEYVLELPDKLRWEIRPSQAPAMLMGYDGTDAWGNWQGPPARYRGWMRDMVIEGLAEMKALLVAPARADGEAFTLESPEPEGEPGAYRVKYAPKGGGTWTLWFDGASGNITRGEHEYRFMDGKPMIGRWERSVPRAFGPITMLTKVTWKGTRDGKVMEEMNETIDEIEWNADLPDDLFRVPPPGMDPAEIGTKKVPAVTVVTVRHTGPYEKVGDTIHRLMDGVYRAGLMPMGPVYGTYLDHPDRTPPEKLRTDVSVPVALMGEPPELPEGFSIQNWPERNVAYAYHAGPYEEEGEAHKRLAAWMKKHRKRSAGPPRAIWYHDPETVVPEDLITEIQVPVR